MDRPSLLVLFGAKSPFSTINTNDLGWPGPPASLAVGAMRLSSPEFECDTQGAHRELHLIPQDRSANMGSRFDGIVVSELSPEIHPLSLLDAIDSLLSSQGTLVFTELRCTKSWFTYLKRQCELRGYESVSTQTSDIAQKPSNVFRRSEKSPRWIVRHSTSTDYEFIADLFKHVFGHELSKELWDWKYASGRGNALIATRGETVVAHYGGIYRDVLIAGKPDRVAQIGDVMVHPTERGVLTRNGPFFLVGSSWPEIYGPKGFGFPTVRAMQVAEKLGLYVEAGKMVEISWSRLQTGPRIQSCLQSIDLHTPGAESVANQLWKAMSTDLSKNVVGVRNWEFLTHRFLKHPHNRYEVFLVKSRWTAKPLGIFVIRTNERLCELLDVIAPFANFGEILQQAQRIAGTRSADKLYCWITDNCKEVFLKHGGAERDLDLRVPASSWTQESYSELFVGKWWLMSGDTDFR